MKKILRHTVLVLLAAFCLCACDKGGKVIPRKKFARIYAEMFLSDAWLTTAPSEARIKSDTTDFYAPIFEKYGYTLEDYLESVSYYLQDPDRFSRILRKSGLLLQSQMKALEAEYEAGVAVEMEPDEADAVMDTLEAPVRERGIRRSGKRSAAPSTGRISTEEETGR